MAATDKNVDSSDRPQYAELVSISDELLMSHVAQGRADALAVLFDRYQRLVLNVALRILRDAGEAEDLMQTVFIEIFQSAAQFDPSRGTTKVWILQYAYHRSFNRREYLNLRGVYTHRCEMTTQVRNELGEPRGSLNLAEARRLVQEALAHLGKAQRVVLEMAFYEGLTMQEIATRTGHSFDSVRHHYYRGLEKLRCLLSDSRSPQQRDPSTGEGVVHAEP